MVNRWNKEKPRGGILETLNRSLLFKRNESKIKTWRNPKEVKKAQPACSPWRVHLQTQSNRASHWQAICFKFYFSRNLNSIWIVCRLRNQTANAKTQQIDTVYWYEKVKTETNYKKEKMVSCSSVFLVLCVQLVSLSSDGEKWTLDCRWNGHIDIEGQSCSAVLLGNFLK